MKTTQFAALTLTALALSAGLAHAGEGDWPETKPTLSLRSRAEVQAEAVQAARNPDYGISGPRAVETTQSYLSRAEVRAATVQANKAHKISMGEAVAS